MIDPMLLVFALHLVVFVAILSELGPRTVTLWRLRAYGDGYGVDRIRTWIKSLGFALVAGYGALLRADLLFFDQTLLGPFPARWWIDAAIWTVAAVGALGVAFLYWSIESRKERQDVEDARAGGKVEAEPS